jgi:hypothetical protein
MPTIQQIEQAMIAADRAGDTAAAQILADEIRRLMEEAQPRKRGIGAAFQRGLESQLSSGRTGVGVFAGTPEEAAEAARAGLARQEDISRRYEDQIGLDRLKKVYEEKGLLAAGKEAARQMPLAIAEQIPQMGAAIGSGRLGAMAGAPLGPAGAVVGGLGAASVPLFLSTAGSQSERRAQEQAARGEPVSIDRGELLKTTAPSTAAELASTLVPLGGQLVSKLTGIPVKAFFGRSAAQAEKLANERLLATLTKGTATGVAVEVPTEIFQQMLERKQAGLPLTGPEAFAEYGETAYRVSLLGPLGAAGRLSEKGAARDELAAQQAAPTTATTTTTAAPITAAPTEAPQVAAEIPIEERRFKDITPVPGAPTAERRFSDITPIPAAPAIFAAPEKADIFKMMDSYDTLKSSLDPLADRIEKARQEGDNETARSLMQEYRDNEAAMNALATQITEAGGVLESAEEAEAAYNKQLKTLDNKIAKEENTIREMSRADVRDYDAVDKAEKRLAKLQAERSAAEEEFQRKRDVLRVKETPKDEQIPLFDTEEQQPKAEEVLKFETREEGKATGKVTGTFTAADIERMTQGPVQPTALSKETEDQIAQKQAQADDLLKQIVAMSPRVSSENVEIGGPKRATDTERQSVLTRLNEARQKYRDLQEQEGRLSEASAQPGFYDNIDSAKSSVRRQITALEQELERMAPRNVNRKFLKDYYDKSTQLNKIYGEIDALNAAPVEQTKQPVDIFDYANQLRTATLNNDPKAIMAIINQLKKERKILPEATRERAEKKAGERAQRGMSEKDKLVQTLGQRLGLPGRISERTVTEEEYQRIADRISYLMDMIDKPVGRAKLSVKDKVEKLGREIAGLTETLKNKDLPPATRQGASKSRNAKVKEYNHLIENVMVPARDEIFALYRSMFTVKEVGPVGSAEKMLAEQAEKTRKDLLKEFEERVENYGPESPQVREFVEKNLSVKMSPQYKRYKKIIEGKGITASPKRVAMEIGRETDEYKKFAAPKEKEIAKRKAAYEKYEADAKAELAKLKARVGETSEDYKNRVNEYTKGAKQKLDAWKNFEKAATKAMDAKAEELGKASPEYRSRKIQATAELKETVTAPIQEKKAELEAAVKALETKAKDKTLTPKQKEAVEKRLAVAQTNLTNFNLENTASLRTTQATRKIAKLSRMQTASEESRARTRTIQEKREPGLLPSQAGEKPEVPFKPKAEPKSPSAMLSAFQAAAAKRLKETGKLQRGSEIESKDLSEKEVEALKNNDLKTAFASIVEDDTNTPINRAVAAALEVYVDETNVTVSDRVYYPPTGEEVLGMATAGQIDISRLGLTQETLLHEGVHSAAERVIQMAKEDITQLSPTQQAAYRELERLFKAIQKDPTITSVNAKSDISEFAAEALSNEKLQNQLRSKPWTLGNAFRSFVSYILQMIGVKNVKNMMEASIASVEALMVPTSVARAEVKETAKAMPKNIGVKEEKPGVFSFKSYVQPGATPSSIVADEPRTIDTLKANFLGIAGRVQFVDKFAAISEAFKKGMDAKKISQLEASNGEYYLRFGENRSQYAQQALTNGPLSRVVSRETPEGKEYIYRSEAGANLMRVFEILEGAGIKNSTELDRMFTVYQAGKRAKQVGWEKLWVGNPAKAKAEYDAVMAQLKSNPQMRDAFEAASVEYKKFNDGLIDFVVQTGAMTKDQADKLKSIDYVPYYRVNKGSGDVELFTDKEVPIRIGNIKDEPQLQQLVGDNTQILPLSVSSVQNAFMLIDMGLRNQRVKDTSFLLHKIGFAKTLAKGEGPANRDTVRFKVKGESYYAIIDTDLYGIPADLIVKGMEGIKTSLPMAVKMMGVPADILRKFVTRNPAYAIRQAIRDPLTAWMTTGTDGVPIFNSFKQLSSMVAGRSETERKLMETGAISSNVFTGGPEDFKRFLRDISAGKSGWEKLMAKADAFAMQGDAATRAVVYEDSIAKGLSEQQALLRTLESMNFGRRGLSPTMYYLNTLIPFFNAQVQGLDVLYRAFTNKMPYSEQLKIREKLIARGLLMGAATLAYAAMMQDDEAYKRAKPEERLANWFVYIPGMDQPLKVPIPFELGYLFKSLPEAVFNMGAADEKSQDITKGMGKLMMLSNPFALPQAVKPVTELYLGKSFFGGDIESQREITNMLPTERFRSTTTELSKVLGGATGDAGITPIGWDHLIRGYTGGLGIALISLANPILNTEASAVEQPSKKLHQQPFIGGLFQPVEGRGTLDAAYERMLEIQQAKGTFNRLVEEGRKKEALEFLDTYRNKLIASSLSGAVQQKLGELATVRRRVIGLPNLSQEQKDKILERIDDQQVLIAQKFLSITGETKPQAARP